MGALDPHVLADLKAAAETYSFLHTQGQSVEFWEIVRLAKVNRSLLEIELKKPERSKASVGPIMEELQPIRQQLSSTVKRLREFLAGGPGKTERSERLEIALSFLLASSKEQQLVGRWLAEPDKHLRKARTKINALAAIADPYREALLPWHLEIKPAHAPAPATAPIAAPAPMEPFSDDGDDPFDRDTFEPIEADAAPEAQVNPPSGPDIPAYQPPIAADPSILADLRIAFQLREVFEETLQPTDMWELILLVMTDRSKITDELREISRAREDKKLARFHEVARNLYTRVLALRSTEAVWVRSLRDFLARLPAGSISQDTLELSLGLLVVSTIGRKEAKKWLDAPGKHLDEAVGRLKEIVLQARAYQAQLGPA